MQKILSKQAIIGANREEKSLEIIKHVFLSETLDYTKLHHNQANHNPIDSNRDMRSERELDRQDREDIVYINFILADATGDQRDFGKYPIRRAQGHG